jgi:hypothetical protein
LIAFPHCSWWCRHVWCSWDEIERASATFVARERKTIGSCRRNRCRHLCPHRFEGKP